MADTSPTGFTCPYCALKTVEYVIPVPLEGYADDRYRCTSADCDYASPHPPSREFPKEERE